MHPLEMQILQFLDLNPHSQHSAIFPAFQAVYKSTRTFYKAYNHLIKQNLIQKILHQGEKYYRYELTPLGLSFLHPDSNGNSTQQISVDRLEPERKNSPTAEKNDIGNFMYPQNPTFSQDSLLDLRNELQLLHAAITDLPKAIEDSLKATQNSLVLPTPSNMVPNSLNDGLTLTTFGDDDDYFPSDENIDENIEENSQEKSQTLEPVQIDSLVASENPIKESAIDNPKNINKLNHPNIPETSFNVHNSVQSSSIDSNISSGSNSSPIIDGKILDVLEGLMGAINGLNANIQLISKPSMNPNLNSKMDNESQSGSFNNSSVNDNEISNPSPLEHSSPVLGKSAKNVKTPRKRTVKPIPSFTSDIALENPNLPIIGAPNTNEIDNTSIPEPEKPLLPPIITDLGTVNIPELINLLSQSFRTRNISALDDPYLQQIYRIENELIQRCQRGENLTIAQKNEIIGYYFTNETPDANDITHLWNFLCQIPLQYQDLVILSPLVDYLVDGAKLEDIIDKFAQLPFFALESLLSKPNIKRNPDLYLATLEKYLRHPLFRDKKTSGSESAVKLWIQWHQHFLELCIQSYEYDDILTKCDGLMPDEDLDDIFYYLSVDRVRDMIMQIVSEARMLRVLRKTPIAPNRDDILKETFQVFQESGGYQNDHLIDWYEKMHELDLLEFDDFMRELQILLNLRAFSLIQTRIDQYGLFLEKGIKRIFAPPPDYHRVLLNPELNDKDERTILLRDILINSLYLEGKFEEIIDRYKNSTDIHIFPWLIKSAIKLGVLSKKQWSLPVARPWWTLVTAQIELSVQDKNTELAQIEPLLRQQLNYGLAKHNPYDFFKTYFKEKPEMIRFASSFARWLKEFGDMEHSLELVQLWESQIVPNLRYLDIHFEILQLKRELLPSSEKEIDEQLKELEDLQKHAYDHNIKAVTSTSLMKRKKKTKKS
jgi:hypothetical protein